MAEEKQIRLTGNQIEQLAVQERQKLAEVNRRISSLQGFRNELHAAHDSIEEITKTDKGEKMLVNLGAGVFVNATLEENSKAITSIAGSAFREKTNKEIVKSLSQKISALEKNLSTVAEEQQKTIARLTQLEQIISAGRQYMAKERSAKA